MAETHELRFNVILDENKIPEQLTWEQNKETRPIKAAFLQTWDEQEKITMSLHLWTKTFTTQEMKLFFHQSLVAMVESLERAVPQEEETIKDLYATCNYLAEKMELISKEQEKELIQKAKNEEQLGKENIDLRDLL